MTAFGHSQWREGFPFSSSMIRAGRSLRAEGVNAPSLADAHEPSAAPVPSPAPAQASTPSALQPAWREAHPVGRQSGMRLLPLEAFLWGSRSIPPQPRTRPDHAVIWVTEGRVQLDFPRDRFCLRAGDLRYLPAGTAFAALPGPGARGHVALISARLAAGAAPPLPDRVLAAQVGVHAAQLEATLREIGVEPQGDPGASTCLANLLALRLKQLEPHRTDNRPDAGLPDRPLIDRFLTLARDRLGECPSVAELAAGLGSSALLLDEACLAAHGKRAVELMHDLRLACAVRLLRETARPIQRIAADLGYSSHAHFTRAFAAATGRPPEAFRAQSC